MVGFSWEGAIPILGVENFVDNSERGRFLLGGIGVENFSTGFQQLNRVPDGYKKDIFGVKNRGKINSF